MQVTQLRCLVWVSTEAAACLKNPQRKTFAAVVKGCRANPPGWLRSGVALALVLFADDHSHVDGKQQPSRELGLANV